MVKTSSGFRCLTMYTLNCNSCIVVHLGGVGVNILKPKGKFRKQLVLWGKLEK